MTSQSSSRFIGRRQERLRLAAGIAESRHGGGRIFLIEGEAGIGKSRLLNEVTRGARNDGHRVLVGGCVNLHEDTAPLAPIAEALRALAAETSADELDRLLGPAGDVLAGLLPASMDADSAERAGPTHALPQQGLHARLVDLIARISRQRPLVLVVEDIHWADSATLDLLSLLARSVRALPIALLLSQRTDEADANNKPTVFMAELERLAHPEHVRLPRFTRGEVSEQVAAIRGPQAIDPALVDAVLTRSQGNPFYAEELLAAGSEAGELQATLRDVLEARLATLSSDARRVVDAAAVRSADSTEDELAAVTALDAQTLEAALHELLDRKILERRRAGGREVLGFRHVLIETAAYQDLLASQRRRLHRAYAELLERQVLTAPDPFRLAELARHWDEAGEATRALAASIRAASAADSSYQPALANEQYERALRLIGALPAGALPAGALDPSLDRVELFERAGRAAAGAGSPRSIDHILGAIELVDATFDPVRAGLLHERLGRYRWYDADGEGALAAYTEAVRLVPPRPPSAARARVTAGLGQLLNILARFEESARYCDEALATARAVGEPVIEAHAMNTMGVNTAYLGDLERGLELLWSSKEIAEQAGSVEDVGRAYANLVDVLLTGGRYAEAAELGLSSWKYQLEHGLVSVYGGAVLTYAAWALHILARWPEAIAALELAAQYPIDANSRVHMLAVRAMVDACRGDLEQAQSHLDMARPQIAHAIDTQLILPFSEADAEVALGAGRPGDALQAVADGIARSEPLVGGNIKRYGPVYAIGMRAAGDRVAQAGIGESDAAEARRVARDLMSAMVDAHRQISSHHPGHLQLAEPYLALCQAEQTRVARASDPEAWDLAAQSLARLGRPYLHAYALWRLAQADLALHGRSERTERSLRAAYRLALEIGAQPLRASIEDLAHRARVTLTAKARDEAANGARFGLTQREMEVLALVAQGKTNREIGERLFISAKTASVHVSNVLAKLGAERRSEAAAVAARIGLGGASDEDTNTVPDGPRRS